MSIDISIITVNYNSLNYIKSCVDSISSSLCSKGPAFCELIIVDNGSSDGSADYIERLTEQYGNIYLTGESKNLGFCKACNLGASKANGKFLLFLNPDTKFISGSTEEVIRFYDKKSKDSKVGVIGAKLVNPDGTIQYSCRSFPTLARQFYESYFLYRLFKNSPVFGAYFLSWWDHNSAREVDWLSGAFMFMKREDFDRTGGFDEDYFMYSEDSDLCFRLCKNGYRNYYFPFFVVEHADGGIASINNALREACVWKSRRLYFKKNYSSFHAVLLSFIYFLGVINRIIIFTILSIFTTKKQNRKRLQTYLKTLKLYFAGRPVKKIIDMK